MATVALIWAKTWPILVAILYFGFLILSHEIGHFSAARAFRVRVQEFSMGMGPRLFSRKRGETLYSLKAIPFGGSVLMDEDEGESDDPRAFVNQKAWKRFCILFAGALVNILCGVIIMGVIVGMNPKLNSTRVDSFEDYAISQEQGLQKGDEIYKIDGRRAYTWLDVGFLCTRSKAGTVDLVVKRGGQKVKLDQFKLMKFYDQRDPEEEFYYYDYNLQVYAKRGPGIFLKETVLHSVSIGRMVWLSLLDMVTGKFKLRDISGPIGVVSMLSSSGQEVQQGLDENDKSAALQSLLQLFLLFAMISINIGIMNLLPLPALDGGRLLFCVVEMIFRKPIPKKFEAWVHGVGIVLLMVFMVIVMFSDIIGLIKR